MCRILLATISVLALSACSTVNLNKFKPEQTAVVADVPVPPTDATSGQTDWAQAAPEDLPRTDWIASFDDAQLLSLVNTALAKNTDIRTAEARYSAALARLGISQADLKPNVSLSGQARRSEPLGGSTGSTTFVDQFGNVQTVGGGGGGRTDLSSSINASWEYDLWGRIRDGVDASELELSATDADYAGARLAVAARVTQTWFDLIEARLLVELSERDVETLTRALRLTTRRFEGGVTGSSDVRLARSSLASSKAVQASRKQRLAALSRGLEVLLREYPDNDLIAAADLPRLPDLSGAGTPAFVLRHRPDILANERRMQAAGLQVDVARKALLPSLTFSGGTTQTGTALNNFFDLDNIIANIAGGISAPIFQGGRLKANIEQQEAVLRQQLEGYTATVLNAYLEVENALDAERRLEEREAALRVSLQESVEAERRLELRYTEGLASILQLLDSQTRRLNAESQLISARKERLANRVRLHVALGGGDITEQSPALVSAPPVSIAQNSGTIATLGE